MRYPDFDLFDIDASHMIFSHSPLLDALRKRQLATNPRLLDLLSDEETNFTMAFVEDLIWRAEHKSNILINLRGARGCGKSTLAQGIKSFLAKSTCPVTKAQLPVNFS
jgi:predicted AAA+ superfamily ATPase